MFRIAKVQKRKPRLTRKIMNARTKRKRRFTTVKPFDFLKHIGSCLVILLVIQKKKLFQHDTLFKYQSCDPSESTGSFNTYTNQYRDATIGVNGQDIATSKKCMIDY
jgi:hypothetical protein